MKQLAMFKQSPQGAFSRAPRTDELQRFARCSFWDDRQPFTDEAWTKSSEQLQTLAVSLAECVMPFDKHPYLPIQHAAALSLVGRLSELCRGAGKEERDGVPTELFSCLKYSIKKNGVARAAADVSRLIDQHNKHEHKNNARLSFFFLFSNV